MSIITGIVLLIIGIVLWAVSRQLPPGVSTAAYWIGIVLAVIGLIVLVLAVLGITIGTAGLLILPALL